LKRLADDTEYRFQGGAPRPPAPPRPAVAAPPPGPPPAAAPGRRGDAFDPAQNPAAPGVPRALGSTTASVPLAQGPDAAEEAPIGAPGGRAAGAPLDLSIALGGAPAIDPPLAPLGGSPPNDQPPPPRNPSGTGAQVATLPPSDSPKDNYDLAYGYLLRKDYALADDGFRAFLRKYPSDRLAPDAQYWLGESLFQRQRFRDAAESFLNVSTKYEATAKAPDALLRLGQSLAALGEKEAACASLAEVARKYPRAAVGVKQGVEREQKRVRC
jgi:tol-pal system protein YbgF